MRYVRTHIYNLFSELKIICTYSNGLWYLISKQSGKIRIIHNWQADLWCKKLWTFWWMSISVIFYDGIKSSHSVRIIFLSYNLVQKCSPDTSQHQTPPTNSFQQWNRSICLIWSINLRTVRSSPSLFPFICEFVFVLVDSNEQQHFAVSFGWSSPNSDGEFYDCCYPFSFWYACTRVYVRLNVWVITEKYMTRRDELDDFLPPPPPPPPTPSSLCSRFFPVSMLLFLCFHLVRVIRFYLFVFFDSKVEKMCEFFSLFSLFGRYECSFLAI